MTVSKLWPALLIISFVIVIGNAQSSKLGNAYSQSATPAPDDSYGDNNARADSDTSDSTTSSFMDSYPSPVNPAFDTWDSVRWDTVVLEMKIEAPLSTRNPAKVVFTKDALNHLHKCLCKNSAWKCIVRLAGSNVQGVTQLGASSYDSQSSFSNKYVCQVRNSMSLECQKLRSSEYVQRCEDNRAMCVPQVMFSGMGCELGTVYILWDPTQVMSVVHTHPSLTSRFVCDRGCDNDHNEDKENKEENKEDGGGDGISPAIIGVIVACVVIVLIIVIVFTIWVVKQRRQAKANAHHRSAAHSASFDGVDIGRVGEFQKTRNQNDLKAFGAGQNGARSSPSAPPADDTRNKAGEPGKFPAGNNNNNNNNNVANSNRKGKHKIKTPNPNNEEATYESIEEPYSHNYTPLDDALRYIHPYNALQPPTPDPKVRPRMPLPAQPINGTLPYYSMPKFPGNDQANANTDNQGGQYVELMDETPSGPPVNNSGYLQPGVPLSAMDNNGHNQPASATQRPANYSPEALQSPQANQNNYFELERVDSSDETSPEPYSPDPTRAEGNEQRS